MIDSEKDVSGGQIDIGVGKRQLAIGTDQVARLESGPDGDREASLFQVAQIVHDFKSPLMTIALELCVIEDRLECNDRREVTAATNRIAQTVAFLDRLVLDILDTSCIDAGRLVLRRSLVDLHRLVERVIERMVPPRDRDRVVVDRAQTVACIDELRIERVVGNLISNALKYSPSRTAIEIRFEHVADFERISVIDAGPGIAPSDADAIFDKFRRGTTQGREGSGLGLYASKRIVEAHGGRIGFESTPGVGSRFFVDLPSR